MENNITELIFLGLLVAALVVSTLLTRRTRKQLEAIQRHIERLRGY